MAPELPGALGVISALSSRGVLVSAGHSNATFEEAVAGFDAGARYGTHLFNAMSALGHRDPGLPGALLTDSRPTVGVIADGVHTHRSVIRLAWQALGPHRMNLVTDAMAALGMPAGSHLLGDFEVVVDATSARLADGTLAGSILSLDQALRNLDRGHRLHADRRAADDHHDAGAGDWRGPRARPHCARLRRRPGAADGGPARQRDDRGRRGRSLELGRTRRSRRVAIRLPTPLRVLLRRRRVDDDDGLRFALGGLRLAAVVTRAPSTGRRPPGRPSSLRPVWP